MLTKRFVQHAASFSLAAMLLMPGSAVLAQTGSIKIGYVNTEKILRDAAPAKAAQQKLEREFSVRDKELQALASDLKAKGERFERDSAVMSEKDRRRTQREFADAEKDFQRRQREFREDLSQRRNEELSAVLEKANQAIREISEKEQYDIIVQEAVVTSKRIDITDKVIKALAK